MTNCRTGKGDEALSFWFLMLWIFGDSTNLIGAIFSKQLGTEVYTKHYKLHTTSEFHDVIYMHTKLNFLQIATAVYYLLLDFITMAQYLFYVIKNQGCDGK